MITRAPVAAPPEAAAAVRWTWKEFEALTARELYALLALRAAVFIVEQNCPYQDADGVDPMCRHLIGWRGAEAVACLRLVPPGIKCAEASLGRVVSAQSVRGSGVGRALFAEGVKEAERVYPGQPIRIGAQAYLERFYSSFGFKTVSAPYLEDGIPHVEMLRAETPGSTAAP